MSMEQVYFEETVKLRWELAQKKKELREKEDQIIRLQVLVRSLEAEAKQESMLLNAISMRRDR